MSVQILLQGKFAGIEEFLFSQAHPSEWAASDANGTRFMLGRARWIGLLAEVLPRALLAELGLARILLGSSGGDQFLVVLPDESRQAADAFISAAQQRVAEMSGQTVRLVWTVTEYLGDWSDVRKRLTDELERRRQAPLPGGAGRSFEPVAAREIPDTGGYFASELGEKLNNAEVVGWSPEEPEKIQASGGKHQWPLSPQPDLDAIPFSRHVALADDGQTPASVRGLAARSEGLRTWGVLLANVDGVATRLRRAQTIEEHLQLSMMYKQFFAGELAVACSLPDFWRKTTIICTGGADLAVYGAWNALPALAREIQRLFHRFSEENLKDFPGPEGKTISMAIALATHPEEPFSQVLQDAYGRLELAKSSDKDCIHLFGRTLEWKQLADAAELAESLARMAKEFGSSRQFFSELTSVYRKARTPHAEAGGRSEAQFDRPWRFHRRIHRAFGNLREREFQRLRSHLVHEAPGRGVAHVRLRPAGRVALEWARLNTEV